jgi:hypothetical protein
MSEFTATKRKYVRVDPSTWSEIEALWEAGDVTLQDLEGRFGVSRRALQAHFSKRDLTKGSKAAQIVAAVKEKVFSDTLPDVDETTVRAKATREAAYRNAVIVEDLIMAQLSAAQKDPSQALKAASAIKALSLAAAGLERIHELKWKALGLDKESALSDELPILIIKDLSEEEIATMRERSEEGDEEDFGDYEDLCDANSPPAPDEEDVMLIKGQEEEVHCEEHEDLELSAIVPTGPRLVRNAA